MTEAWRGGGLLKCHIPSFSWPSDLFPSFLRLPISLHFMLLVPLHRLFPCTQYYFCLGSGFLPNALQSGAIPERLRHLNNKERAGQTSPVTPHWHDYLEKVCKIYIGEEFILACSRAVIKGLCAKQKSFSEQRHSLRLTARLTMDFILQAQSGVRLIVWNCSSTVDSL